MPLLRNRESALIDALNRGFAPRRAAYPTLAGRQRPEVYGLCQLGFDWVCLRQGLLDASVCVPP